jgi:hypothetical protein
MTIDNFVQLLAETRPTSRGWRARCPAHQGKSFSLSIREAEDGRILVHCFAGCPTEIVCHALHLPVRELFGPSLQDAAEIQRARKQRGLYRWERERVQRDQAEAADAERKARRLIVSAKNVSIAKWSNDFILPTLNRLADAYGLIGEPYVEE